MRLEDWDAGWHVLSEEGITEMKAWRTQHPRATFQEIETALDERWARLRVRMLEDSVLASPATDVSTANEPDRPVCPQCATPLEARGQPSRELLTHSDQRIELKRSYALCPHCQVGLFPPR